MNVVRLIELIAAVALGLAVARVKMLDPNFVKLHHDSSWGEWLFEGGDCLFAGIALFRGVSSNGTVVRGPT